MFLNDEQLDLVVDVFGLRDDMKYNIMHDEMLYGIDVHTRWMGWKNEFAFVEYTESRDASGNLVDVCLDVRPAHAEMRFLHGAIEIHVFLHECETVLDLRKNMAQLEQVVKDAEATRAKAQAEIDKVDILLSYLEAAL